MKINGDIVELVAALGEIRFSLSSSYEGSDRDRIEQAIAVIDYAMKPYSDADLDGCIAFSNNPFLRKE